MNFCKYILLFLLFVVNYSQAQQTVTGIVVDQETGRPLQHVIVSDLKSNNWKVTNEQGAFKILLPSAAIYQLNFRLLGMQEQSRTYSRTDVQQPLRIALESQNLRLDEVTVSARKGKNFSEIIIGAEVIDQVQAFSLSDVLEQLPGQSITNFDINEFKTIAFRTVKPTRIGNAAFGNKSFGTAIVVDGIPISNNENMQSYGGNYGAPFSPNTLGFGDVSGGSGFNGYFSNANYSADLREIPVDNIEKIEVVQGIPSARYGDLTSGLIRIEQRAGRSPYRLYTSLRDGTYEYGISKGFRISERAGFINASVNYLRSNSEPRVSYTQFDRITTNLMWSYSNSSIRNSFSVDYSFDKDNVNYEAEDTNDKIVKNNKKSISLSNRFKWNVYKRFVDNLDINMNFKYADQYTYESQFVNIGGSIVGTSIEEGVYTGTYTLPSYTTVKAVEGIPISAFLASDLHKSFATGLWSHNLSYGGSVRMSDNKGRGRLGSPETMNSTFTNTNGGDGQAFRPYNYGDNVRAEYQFSVYAEDNISRDWDKYELHLNAGLRYDNQNGYSFLAPRINTYLAGEKYKVRAGFGLTSKAPSLNQVYTGPRYYDAVLGDYRLPGQYNLGIVQTFVDYADNKNLKPSKSIRSEIGFDYNLPFGSINITGFYNELYDGITNEGLPGVRGMADLDITFNGDELPTYTIAGYTPFYFSQNTLVNKYSSHDKGVEFFMSFDKSPLRNVKFDLMGSYVETVNLNDVNTFFRSTDREAEEKYGIYKGYPEYYRNFKVGSNITYHLAKLGLLIALRTEHFIIDENNYDSNVRPYAYLDAGLNTILIPEEQRDNTELYGHIIRSGSEYYRQTDKIFHNFHLRVSKEFLNGFRFSFYANNFLDLKQTERSLSNGSYVTRIKADMVTLSFGTKIEYQF